MIIETPKGMKDILPEKKIIIDDTIEKLKSIFELYGFSPMDTPIVEKFEILSSKFAGGEEILKETFKLSDQGKRDLGLRYDLTVPFARVIAMNPKIKLPFKRYQIGKVYRDGPVGMARYREFMQCDVDVVGAKTMYYDSELLLIAGRFFKMMGLNARIRLNNRKILNELIESLGIKKDKIESVILSIDKLEKFGKKEVIKELKEKGFDEDLSKKIISACSYDIEKLKTIIPECEGLKETEKILKICRKFKVEVEFDVSLARGLSYYTGSIFEVYLVDNKVKSSVCAGGRYDHLISQIVGSGNFPAVGISFGLSRIIDALERKSKETVTELFIIPFGDLENALEITEQLRDKGIKTEIDLAGRGPSKNIKYADSKGIEFVGFYGDEEQKLGKIKLKNIISGKEELVDIDEVLSRIKK